MKNITKVLGEKAYIAVTCAKNCFFGASVVENADETSLSAGYGVFKQETQDIQANYTPKTVTTDGWRATQNAWKTLFSSIFLMACFLHIYIKIRDRAKKKYSDIFLDVSVN